MNKIIKLFLAISLLITYFTVNAIAEDNNASEVQLQLENGELEILPAPENISQVLYEGNKSEILDIYSVEQTDMVILF